jgi:hypothetical protein
MAVSNTITAIIPTIFAQGLNALRNRCVMPALINNSYSTNAMEKGQVISIPIPSDITTNAVVPGPYAPDTGNVAPTVAQITLDNWQEAAFTLNEQEIGQAANGYPSRQVTAAVAALADYVNGTIFAKYTKLNNYVGSAGTTPFATTVDAAVDAKEKLTQWKAPLGDRRLVLDTYAMGNALKLGAFSYMLNSNDPGVMKEGDIGRKYGFNWFEDQQVPRHVSGTITTGLIAKAATGVAAGLKTFVGTTAATTGACNLKVGDIIIIAGHNRTYALTATSVQASASSDVTLTFNAPLEFALVGSEAVTVLAAHRVNMAFHADCFGFASRTLAPIAGAEPNPYTMELADPTSGLTLRLQVREEFHRIRWAFDLLWGVDVVRPDLGLRMAGA